MKAEHSRRATNTHTQQTPTLSFVKGLHHPTTVFIYKQDRQGSTVWKHLCTSHSAMVNPCLVDVLKKNTQLFLVYSESTAFKQEARAKQPRCYQELARPVGSSS